VLAAVFALIVAPLASLDVAISRRPAKHEHVIIEVAGAIALAGIAGRTSDHEDKREQERPHPRRAEISLAPRTRGSELSLQGAESDEAISFPITIASLRSQ